MFFRERRSKGAGIVEAGVGLFVVIPLVLALVDVGSMVVCQTSNDALAKQACRAAASAVPGQDRAAADAIVAKWGSSAIANNPQIVTWRPDPQGAGQVYLETQMTCTLPIPIPMGFTSINFRAQDIEPYTTVLPN